jgi:hypothetical protein
MPPGWGSETARTPIHTHRIHRRFGDSNTSQTCPMRVLSLAWNEPGGQTAGNRSPTQLDRGTPAQKTRSSRRLPGQTGQPEMLQILHLLSTKPTGSGHQDPPAHTRAWLALDVSRRCWFPRSPPSAPTHSSSHPGPSQARSSRFVRRMLGLWHTCRRAMTCRYAVSNIPLTTRPSLLLQR